MESNANRFGSFAVIDNQTEIDVVETPQQRTENTGFEIVKSYNGLNDLHLLKTL